MKVQACKKCDLCGKVVAIKGLFYHATEDYMTVVNHTPPSYGDDGESRTKWHYCMPCWMSITAAARNILRGE